MISISPDQEKHWLRNQDNVISLLLTGKVNLEGIAALDPSYFKAGARKMFITAYKSYLIEMDEVIEYVSTQKLIEYLYKLYPNSRINVS